MAAALKAADAAVRKFRMNLYVLQDNVWGVWAPSLPDSLVQQYESVKAAHGRLNAAHSDSEAGDDLECWGMTYAEWCAEGLKLRGGGDAKLRVG